ncbi:allatostatin-A receptor isoform X1 [Drosophila pseudoobscura]|uniref:Allatostatin-A receptor isoform X1 n=1 Tax=Drosophila pseudoobscura pseudoobscura TaxID=46245 RepID=A0A6I8VQ52_DROPS|nr:allatostatin-A receptor isoform X1 [Drosophila pseudoobscura]
MENITISLSNITNGSAGSVTPAPFFSEEDRKSIEDTVRWLVPFFFGIIAVTGFFGNLLVIMVVVVNKNMRSTTNLLILNLAVSDLLFVIICIPFTATDYITQRWPFGNFWCRTTQYLIVVTAFASIYTLVLMSIDRFLAVVHPIRSRMLRTEHITMIAIFTLWTVVLTISMPVTFAHDVMVHYDNTSNITYALCRFKDNDLLDASTFQLSFFISTYLLPLMIISGLYVRMITRLWRQGSGVRMSKESQRGRKRVTRLVVVVVIAFASLWLPVQLILLLKALDVYEADSLLSIIIQICAQTLAYSSSCINPLLYAFLSENFRKAFYKMVGSSWLSFLIQKPLNNAASGEHQQGENTFESITAINCSPRYQNYTSDLPPPRKTSCGRTSTTGM